MRYGFLATTELHRRLLSQGHSLCPGARESAETDIWPPPDMIITLAVDTDGTLATAYRNRYFICSQDEDSGTPLVRYAPEFSLPNPFVQLIDHDSQLAAFLSGPMQWLLHRIGQFPKLLLWTSSSYRECDGAWFFQSWERDRVSKLVARIAEVRSVTSDIGALVLDPQDTSDAELIWEAAKFVAASYHDYYLSDLDCKQVFIMHHHDKVVISVPSTVERNNLLLGLASREDLFQLRWWSGGWDGEWRE